MAFDKENTIFFDTEYPLYKETIEKSIGKKTSYFNVYIFDISEICGQAFIEFSIQDVTTPGFVAHNK